MQTVTKIALPQALFVSLYVKNNPKVLPQAFVPLYYQTYQITSNLVCHTLL